MRDQILDAEAIPLDSSSDAVVVVGSDGCIVNVNAQARDMFFYTEDELIGAEVEVLVPEKFASSHRDVRRMRSARGTPRATGLVEGICARRKDGTEIQVTARISSNGDSGRLVVITQKGKDTSGP